MLDFVYEFHTGCSALAALRDSLLYFSGSETKSYTNKKTFFPPSRWRGKMLSWLKITVILASRPHLSTSSTPTIQADPSSQAARGSSCANGKKVHFVLFCLFSSVFVSLTLSLHADNYSKSNNIQRLHGERTSRQSERHQSPSNSAWITFSITKSKC